MARKSRRQSIIANQGTDVSEKAFKVGLYVRLSIEDIRDRKDSDSIENQTYMLKQYVSERPYLQIYSIYTDNGQKGTNFDRPEFKRLMEDVKAGMVNCIVVKDLSRFGRDYLETGNYLEKIFPFLGVRFISINDNYDSFSPENTNEGLIISLKNLLNDVYTKDISKKIITSFKERQSKGEFLGAHVPYGYTRPDDGSYILLVDEEAADVIRQIYRWKIEGLTDTAIARRLNEMNIPCPSKHKYLRGEWKSKKYNENVWQRITVKDITENEVYLGHKIYGKIQVSLYEGRKKTRVPKDQWTIIRNDHEPIIDQESFDIVHNKRILINQEFHEGIARNKHLENTENIFKDIAKCADCKSNLVRRRHIKNNMIEYYYFLCTTFESNSGCKCSKKYIFEDELKEAVYETIKSEIEQVNNIDKTIDKVMVENKTRNESDNNAAEIKRMKTEIEKLQSIRTALFDDYMEQLLTEQEYLYAKNDYDKREEKFRNRLDELFIEQSRFSEVYTHENKYLTAFRRFMDAKELCREMLLALIHSIELNADKSIQINFKFKDDVDELTEYFAAQGIEVQSYE